MNCLFCKQNSDDSRSVEHIIPESLGNVDHVLPKRLVCDKCNQYFALKVEKPLLEQPYFTSVRHRARIESKKGRVPNEKAIILSPGVVAGVELMYDKKDKTSINFLDERQISKVSANTGFKMIIPIFDKPDLDNKVLSRFLAKVAVEGLLYSLLDEEGWIDEIMNKPELENIKKYARYGEGVDFWKYHERRLYAENAIFNHRIDKENYEILHEFKILLTEDHHCYFVLAIMGIEYSINLTVPENESYAEWLKGNNNKSPLDDNNEMIIRKP